MLPEDDIGVTGLLTDIRDLLIHILRYTVPPEAPNVAYADITAMGETHWTPVKKLNSDTVLWSLHNTSDEETVYIAYSNEPDPRAIIPLYPEQCITRGTRPDYIYAQRAEGAEGDPPKLLLEEWAPKEVWRLQDREVSQLGGIGQRSR